ncbi:hypothetical protein EDB87DRAFT_1676473 [Lactarius vividus]|nr:hypothetical protein EDB87DRAFT_1676473 [Lactarius vividus]
MPSETDVKTASVTVEGEPQPVFSSSPTNDTTGLPAPDANAAKPSEALVPAPAPQPRSWLASLSRRGSSNTPLNELAKQTPPLATGERPATPEPPLSTVTVAPPPADLPEPNPVPTTSPVSDPQVTSHASQPETDIKSVPSKRPWFGSSSSSKRPSKLRPMDKSESANNLTRTDSPVPETPQLPVTNVIPPTPPKPELTKVESKPTPESASVPIPSSRKWFSHVSSLPSSRSPPDAETRTSPLAVSHVASPSTPSSIDDQSTISAETDEIRGSSWLSPWSWYGSYGQLITAPNPAQAKEGIDGQAQVQNPSSADADVKEAPATQKSVPTAHIDPTNPIQSTISTNASGWASFFSSKALLAKRITDTEHRDESTMEVMEIDDDEERVEVRTGNDVEMQVTKTAPAPPRSPSPSPKPKVKSDKKPDELKGTKRVSVSPSPSKSSGRASPRVPSPPNLVLPTWEDTFHVPPRSTVLRSQTSSAFLRTVRFVSGMLFARDDGTSTGKGKAPSKDDGNFADFGRDLPRTWDVIGERLDGDLLRGCRRVVVIGIHGWFPGAITRTMLGEPTGTSSKFVTMMCRALEAFQEQHKVHFEKVTQIPLEGEGTINKRVEKLYTNLLANHEWINDLHAADAILVATHSQGSIVSTHLLDRLIHDKHIKTSKTSDLLASASAALSPAGTRPLAPSAQRVCCLALCGIHLGPLRYLSSSSLVLPYIQYFESAAAKELFEFQTTTSEVSKNYVKALRNVVDHGVKMVYIASLNDQVVPLYSGLFTAASHPLILRALYVDGDVYHSSDFLSNLLVLLLRVMNVGLSDSGLLTHLSEATAGSLSGIGHSTAYEELSTYSLAVNYLFMTNEGSNEHPELVLQPFDAKVERNDYEIPWALRDLIANERVAHFFANDFANLRNAFPDWHPKTAILRDIKRKLQPIQRLNTNPSSTPSKL